MRGRKIRTNGRTNEESEERMCGRKEERRGNKTRIVKLDSEINKEEQERRGNKARKGSQGMKRK